MRVRKVPFLRYVVRGPTRPITTDRSDPRRPGLVGPPSITGILARFS